MNKRSRDAINAIYDGIFSLLEKEPFDQITVRGICKESKVNKMTFYKYHSDKFDALSKAFQSKFNNAFMAEFGPNDGTFFDCGVEEACYRTLRFVASWFSKYRDQIHSIYTSSNQIAYEVARSVLYDDYAKFLMESIDQNHCPVSVEYISRFIFSGVAACTETYLKKLRIGTDIESVNQEMDDACRFLAKSMAMMTAEAHCMSDRSL